MLPSALPDHPWEKVAADLFELGKATYLLVVDYFSRYVEVQELSTTTASKVIAILKTIFARYGVPSQFVSDNGPQFDCLEMKKFAKKYGFRHITSSPYYPQSNGLAERAVKTVKQLLQNAPDPHIALLSYRATPLPSCGLSPAELLMGRRIRTDLPQLKQRLVPDWPYLEDFRKADECHKQKQKENYDTRHRTRPLASLPKNAPVWVDTPSGQTPGKVVRPSGEPRSYQVEVPSGEVRRNRMQLRPRLGAEQPTTNPARAQGKVFTTRSKTGSRPGPPDYLH